MTYKDKTICQIWYLHGVSVTIIDESFYVPASAPTVPLFFIATEGRKRQPDGISDAIGTFKHSVVHTITSLSQSVKVFGVPKFRTDAGGQNGLHGDSRNEYGLFALNQFLTVAARAFVVRADVDLSDRPVVQKIALAPVLTLANGSTATGTISDLVVNQNAAVIETWTLQATSATEFSVAGSVSGLQGVATTGVLYNNTKISFQINPGSGVPGQFQPGDVFTIQLTSQTVVDPLGANDAQKRLNIVQALAAQINSNQDVRSEYYEYNLIVCPGYPEVADELLVLQEAIREEAFIIAETPFFKDPDEMAVWAQTTGRKTGRGIAYYYPHGIASNLDGKDVFIAASGVALKQYAYSDSVAELWMAPAGLRRGVVQGLVSTGYLTGTPGTATTYVETALNQGQRDNLYEFFKNINPITFFPGRGIVIWGQKTSAPAASALDRVNVMRLMMMVKRDLRKASMSFVFEPNDQITRDSLKLMVESYLNEIMIRRGLYDFVVLCNESNNYGSRIDRNELWCDVSLKPVKAAEFIYIPLRVVNTAAKI